MQLSSSNFLRASGSSKRAAVPSSRDAVIVGSESDPSHPQTTDAIPGTLHKASSGQRSSPIMSSEHNRPPTGRNSANVKNLESTVRGFESLHFNNEDRVHY